MHIKYSLDVPIKGYGEVRGASCAMAMVQGDTWNHLYVWHGRRRCHQFGNAVNFFCGHFPSAHLVYFWLEIIISYTSQNSTRQPPENRCELVASSWVMYTVCVGRGSSNNRDSKSQRAEFFHSRKNDSHSYSKHSEPCGALSMVKWVPLLFLFISLCIAAGGWWGDKSPYTWFLKDLHKNL